MGPTPVYGARAEKPLQIADFAMKQTNICRLSGDIIRHMTYIYFWQNKPSKSKLPSVRSASVMVAISGSSGRFWLDMELGRLAAFGFGAPGCCSGRPRSTRDNILRRPSTMSLRSSGIIRASWRSDAVRAGLHMYNVYSTISNQIKSNSLKAEGPDGH